MSPWTHRKRRRPSTAITRTSSHRRRRAVFTDAAAANSECPDASSSWESLPADLVHLIGWRLLDTGDLLDYVRLRAVCRGWRSATVSPRGRGVLDPRFHPRRWMMLPEGHGLHPGHGKLRGYVRFLNLSTGAIVRVHLPIFSDHCVLDSVDGILLLQRDQDIAVRLLHPFTGDIAELPPLATLRTGELRLMGWCFFRTVGATAFSVGGDGVVTAMIALHKLGRIAYATTIDQQWKLSTWTIGNHSSPISFHGKIYFLDFDTIFSELKIFEIDLPRRDNTGALCLPAPKLIATCPASKIHVPYRLAECDSEILVIGRRDRNSAHILVYKLADIMLGRIAPITSIGDNALFVEERVLSVSSRVHPTIEGDAIVILHPHRHYLGQYHLADGTWLPAADGSLKEDNGGVPSPSPCSLIYHIFTCCRRSTWNKGALLFQGKRRPSWKVKRKWRDGA